MTMTSFDENDELDQVQPTQKQQAQAVPATVEDDESFELGDKKFASTNKLPRTKSEKGKAKRFAFVPGIKPMARETHYIDGKGTYACTGKDCPGCKIGNQKRTRIVALAIEYVNANIEGKLGKVKPEYAISHVQLSSANYGQMLEVLPEDASIYAVDWKMSNANRAFGYDFSVASNPAAYIKAADQEVVKQLAAEFMGGEDLKRKLGKKASAMELKLALSVGGEDASLDDLDSIQ